jgi:hypothetical protein
MPTNLIPAAAQPACDGGTQVNQWLHGFIEIAKICVIFAGGYFSHWLLLRRDVSGRKRAFRAFVVQFRSEAADRHHPPNTFGQFYQDKVPNLRHAAASITEDFSGDRRVEFERLVSVAAGFTGAQVENYQADKGKKDLLEALDAIIRFIDTS